MSDKQRRVIREGKRKRIKESELRGRSETVQDARENRDGPLKTCAESPNRDLENVSEQRVEQFVHNR